MCSWSRCSSRGIGSEAPTPRSSNHTWRQNDDRRSRNRTSLGSSRNKSTGGNHGGLRTNTSTGPSPKTRQAMRPNGVFRYRTPWSVIGDSQTVATGVSGEPTMPGSRSGGAVSRKRLRSCSRSQRRELVQVPHLAERNAELEQAEVVDRQERVPARVAVLAEQPFDRVVVGDQRRDLRVGDPLEQRVVARVEVRARPVDLHRVRVAVPLEDLGGEAGVQQQHVAGLDDDVVGRHDLLRASRGRRRASRGRGGARGRRARRGPARRGTPCAPSPRWCAKQRCPPPSPRRVGASVRRGRRRRGSRCSRRPPRRRRRRRRTRRRRARASPTASSTAARASPTSSAHTSTYLGSPQSGISLMWTL